MPRRQQSLGLLAVLLANCAHAAPVPLIPRQSASSLPVKIVNNWSSSTMTAWIIGSDMNGVPVAVNPNDASSFIYPTGSLSTDAAIPITSPSTTVTIPDYIKGGRVYAADTNNVTALGLAVSGGGWSYPDFANSDAPCYNVNFGNVEFANVPGSAGVGGAWANIAHVDYVGVPMGFSLTPSSTTGAYAQSPTSTVEAASGVPSGGAAAICQQLQDQSSLWSKLCLSDTASGVTRIISPMHHVAFNDYWDEYINNMWDTCSSNGIDVDTQTSAYGIVNCVTTSGSNGYDNMKCTASSGASATLARPSSTEVWGCTGPFVSDDTMTAAIGHRLCAAFHRSTASSGNTTPSSSETFYNGDTTNFYSKIVHEKEGGNIGYAFPNDDVTMPDGTNWPAEIGGFVASELTITIEDPGMRTVSAGRTVSDNTSTNGEIIADTFNHSNAAEVSNPTATTALSASTTRSTENSSPATTTSITTSITLASSSSSTTTFIATPSQFTLTLTRTATQSFCS